MARNPAQDNRPNAIWIFGDQHRAQALGSAGDPNVHTPHLDRLAVEGVTCPDAVGGFPLCGPYRGALLTGRYPHQVLPGHQEPLPDGTPTVAAPFRDHGYHTSYFGKWHVDGFKEKSGRAAFHTVAPARRGGFDTWIGYENNNAPWDCWVHGHRGEEEIPHERLPRFETDALTDLLIEQIREHGRAQREGKGRPFFSALSVQPPHNPYAAPAEFMRPYVPGRLELRPNVPTIPRIMEQARRDLAGYYALIENLDWNLGRVREALEEEGLAERTHLVFFSDHGDMHGSHGQFKKTSPHEESIRVPFIMGGTRPYEHRRGPRISNPVNHVDIAPTTLGLCGIEAPAWMVGTDYSSHRVPGREADREPDSAYLQSVIPTGHDACVDRPWRGVVTRDGWKYVCLEGQPWMMFNLNEDPCEQANLVHYRSAQPRRVELQQRLAEWIETTGDRFPLPDITTPPAELQADRRVS